MAAAELVMTSSQIKDVLIAQSFAVKVSRPVVSQVRLSTCVDWIPTLFINLYYKIVFAVQQQKNRTKPHGEQAEDNAENKQARLVVG